MSFASPEVKVFDGAAAARRQIELLTGTRASVAHFRIFDDRKPLPAGAVKLDPAKLEGQIDSLGREFAGLQKTELAKFYGIYVVVNEGGQSAVEIKRVRACFIDYDGDKVDPAKGPAVRWQDRQWHVPPHFIVARSDINYHAYWLVEPGFPLDQFQPSQLRLAAHYVSDPDVHDLPRVLRVAGFLWLKNPAAPQPFALHDLTGGGPVSRYTLDQVTAGLAPFENLRNADGSKAQAARPDFEPDDPFNIKEAMKRLPTWEVSRDREHGGNANGMGGRTLTVWTFRELRDLGLSLSAAHDVLTTPFGKEKMSWAERCEEPWEPEDLWTIGESAYRNCANAIGCKAVDPPSTRFREQIEALSAAAPSAEVVDMVAAAVAHIRSTGDYNAALGPLDNQKIVSVLNQLFAVVKRQGVMQVACLLPGNRVDWMSQAEFAKMLQNCRAMVTGGSSARPMEIGKGWLQHPRCRIYDLPAAFRPGVPQEAMPPRVWNEWRGWPYDPAVRGAGDWSLFKGHVRDIICGGDEAIFNYVLGWMASGVQHLDRPLGKAIVLRGEEGCGKTMFGKVYGRVFGEAHYLPLMDAARAAQQFNEFMRSCLLLEANEAFFAGDNKLAEQLKSLITDNRQLIELKGGRATAEGSFIRVIMTGNREHMVRAGPRDRRFVVLDVDSRWAEARHEESPAARTGYFDAIFAELDAGGYQALLYDLMHMDLSGFNISKRPRTLAAVEQKLASLAGFDAWAYEIAADEWLPWPEGRAPKQAVYDHYARAAKERKDYRIMCEADFSRRLRQLLAPQLDSYRPSPHSQRHWLLPPLGVWRAAIERRLGEEGMIPWLEPEDDGPDSDWMV